MTTQTVLILGANGRIGAAAARAFAQAGWRVRGMARRPLENLAGVQWIEGDAGNVHSVRAAAKDADVVVNGLNLAYDKWEKGRAEGQLANVLDALKDLRVTLIFPGNIYNYGQDQLVITPRTRQQPARPKGEIRKRMEEMLEQASGDGLRVLIVRAGDFFGPDCSGTFFDLALLSRLKSGILQYPSTLGHGHSWAYLPDLGRAYVRLAEQKDELGDFENFQFRGYFVTGEQLVGVVRGVLGRPLKVKKMPWGVISLIGVFVPVMRELVKMRYLWDMPHQMRDERLDALLGPDFETPFAEAVTRTVRAIVDAPVQARQGGRLVGALK